MTTWHEHYHPHVGHAHTHPHEHGEYSHHGAPYKKVIDVPEAPDLRLLLRRSIMEAEARKRDGD